MTKNVPAIKHVQNELFPVAVHREIDGVGMGVLENGIPYLTESGLARMCGIDRKVLNRLAKDWEEKSKTARLEKIASILRDNDYDEDTLYIKSIDSNMTEINAYPGPVCLSVLEYYAFSADETKEKARNAYRKMVKFSFDGFIFQSVGYNPREMFDIAWRQFHARASLVGNEVPERYFAIFREVSGLIMDLITSGVPVGPSIVPDGSAGRIWGGYWRDIDGDTTYGKRIEFKHNFPDDFEQSKSNPQRAWAYPEPALAEFRRWLRAAYLPTKYPKYILSLRGKITLETAKKAIESVTDTRIEITGKNSYKMIEG